jgi:hypothetical protein
MNETRFTITEAVHTTCPSSTTVIRSIDSIFKITNVLKKFLFDEELWIERVRRAVAAATQKDTAGVSNRLNSDAPIWLLAWSQFKQSMRWNRNRAAVAMEHIFLETTDTAPPSPQE